MMPTMRRNAMACGLLIALAAGSARADFEIALREGGTLVAKSYEFVGDALVVHQPAGEVRILRSRVTNIRDLGEAPQAPPAKPPAPAAVAPDAAASPMPPPPPHSILTAEDAAERDRVVVRASILARRALLFAENRGEASPDLERRKMAVQKLDAERASLKKLLDPQ